MNHRDVAKKKRSEAGFFFDHATSKVPVLCFVVISSPSAGRISQQLALSYIPGTIYCDKLCGVTWL